MLESCSLDWNRLKAQWLRIRTAVPHSESDWDVHDTPRMDVSGKHSKWPEALFKIPMITLCVLTINFLES